MRLRATGLSGPLLLLFSCLGMLVGSAAASAAEDPSAAGAYCPFPEPGQKPVCITPVEERYPEFLSGAQAGALDDAAAAAVEADLQNPENQDAYLALSSLAYAYYRLAQQEAANPGADPTLVLRLEHWNELLSSVYRDAATDPAFRGALYEAASDLHARAPAVGPDCQPGSDGCDTTSGLMLALKSADEFSENQGVRGALARLLGRILGRDASGAP